MRSGIYRKLTTTSPEGALWCGVEVEGYWCEGRPRSKSYLFVRAHATRYTKAREQRNFSRNCSGMSEAEVLTLCRELTEEFTRWEAARRSPAPEVLAAPWSKREVEVLVRLDRRQPWRPAVIWLEELAAKAKPKSAAFFYTMLDRMVSRDRPTRTQLTKAARRLNERGGAA